MGTDEAAAALNNTAAPMSAPVSAPESASAPAPEPGAPQGHPPARGGILDTLTRAFPRIDDTLFPVFAGACVLYAAVAFYRSMHAQTGGVWSAPLDDVFIHFDYARATARGYPFEWSEGNGFSSGNTSVLYPFVLGLGYWAGFRGLLLMQWAALVACASTLAFFLCSARVCEPLGRWAKYLIPPVVLSVGALNWSLWSGMENALHLGVWGLTLIASLAVLKDPPDARAIRRRSLLAGAAGALLFVTRPESVVSIAAFGIFVAMAVKKRFGAREALFALLLIGLPGAIALGLQAGANRLFTGEWSSAGAITKLAINHPYMTPTEKWNEYVFHLKYVVLRLAHHHFSSALPWGWLVPAAALIGLAKKNTRPLALLLWAQVLGWLALVAMNGQVRWQNERYTMSAVAWLLVLAALGLATLMSGLPPKPRLFWAARVAAAAALSALFWHFQAPNMRDQIWFFGRASRNIRDQHIVAGQVLAGLSAQRVLVGDAGALIYASDRPGLDIIGLGGYHDFPFARAGAHGLGASIELIERMPAEDRPDFMAIYPSWWGDLPSLFGKRLVAVPVVGNVICGGAEKVIYRARWDALDRDGAPRSIREDEVVIDELDIADLMSERAHKYVFPTPSMGFVGFHVLKDPAKPSSDLFDAGRHIPHGRRETAELQAPKGPGRLVVRTVAPDAGVVEVRASGRVLGRLSADKLRGWAEPSIDLPTDLPSPFEIELTRVEGEWTSYHIWVLGGGNDPARRAPRDPSRESAP